jgi:hypothetical protein
MVLGSEAAQIGAHLADECLHRHYFDSIQSVFNPEWSKYSNALKGHGFLR